MEQDCLWHNRKEVPVDSEQLGLRGCLASYFSLPLEIYSINHIGFFKKVKWKIGSKERIRFWEDVWYEEKPLSSKFPALYRISSIHDQPIASFLSAFDLQGGGFVSWNLQFSQNPTDRELREVSELIVTVERVRLNGVVQDR